MFLLVYDVGFQLSFLATLGLIVVSPQFENLMSSVPSRGQLKEFFIATISTQVMILPLLLYQIGQFSVVAVLVNMLVLPMVPVAMMLTFITGVVALLSPHLAAVVGVLAFLSLKYIILLATSFAALPFASFIVPAFPFFVVPVLYTFIGLGLYRLYARSRLPSINLSDFANWTIVEEIDMPILEQRKRAS